MSRVRVVDGFTVGHEILSFPVGSVQTRPRPHLSHACCVYTKGQAKEVRDFEGENVFDVVNDQHVFGWHANVPRAVLETHIMSVEMDKLKGVGVTYPSDFRMSVGAWNVSLDSYSRIIEVNDDHP